MSAKKTNRYRLVLFSLLLALLWLLLSGHSEWFILVLGGASVLLVSWLAVRMRLLDEEEHGLRLFPRGISYGWWLLVQIVRSNWDVARRIISPSLPIEPVEVNVPSTQKGERGRAIFANSITLTPGTVAMSVSEREIHVHALTRAAAEELLAGEMDRRVTELERPS